MEERTTGLSCPMVADAIPSAYFIHRALPIPGLLTPTLLFGFCRAIEALVTSTCADLIHTCILIGFRRPEPVLVVEVRPSILTRFSETELKQEILRRLLPVQTKMWAYEQIKYKRQVKLVGEGVLPRTGAKGNVKRGEVEGMFREELDGMYGEGFRL